MAILKMLLKISSVDKIGSNKSNILQQRVPQIFVTWIDRLCYCLGQLSFITDCESMEKKHLPKCFKPEYEDVLFDRLVTARDKARPLLFCNFPPVKKIDSPRKTEH